MRSLALGAAAALAALTAQAETLQIGVLADINGTACETGYPRTSTTALDQLLGQHQLDHVIMTGDAVGGECLNYRGSAPYQSVVRSMWEEFDEKFLQPVRSREGVGLVLAPGNHDAPFFTNRETFRVENAEFQRYWGGLKPHLPVTIVQAPGLSDHYPYYWAYVVENVFFLVLQSTRTHELSNSTEQKRWLRAVLQTPEARNAKARIAFGHVPAYPVLDPSVGNKFKEIIEKEQVGQPNSLLDLLLDHGVDLLATGHSHAPYPAELTRKADGRKMKVLSMPCGHAPRKLRGKRELAPRGFAVVEIGDTISVSVKNWSDGKSIPASYFPESISMNSKVAYQRMKEIR